MDERGEQREKSFLHQPERTGEFLVVRQLMKENSVLSTKSDTTVWKVHDDDNDGTVVLATEHRTPRKDKPNCIDQRTLYNSKRTRVACRVLDHSPARPPKLIRRATVMGNRKGGERNFIPSNCGNNQQIDGFRYMIMNSFYKTPASPPPSINPLAQPLIREGSLYFHLVESLKRQKQKRDQIEIAVSLLKPVTCKFNEGSGKEYCDILGPVSCSRCIESTNRHIATEIQKGIFPDIEVTLKSLVVPSVSKVMKNDLARKKRFREMSVLNINGFSLRRHETQLRQSELRQQVTKSTKVPRFSSTERLPELTSSFLTAKNISSLTSRNMTPVTSIHK